MHSVTSNAVYNATRNINSADADITYHDAKMNFRRVGRVVTFSIGGAFRNVPAGGWHNVGTVPEGYRPPVEQLTFREQTGVGLVLRFFTSGTITLYNYTGASVSVSNGFLEGTWITNE